MDYDTYLYQISPQVEEVMVAASLIDSDIGPRAFLMPRTGWGRHGISQGETIFEHTCKEGIATWEYTGCQNAVNEVVVHDMPEIITGDKLPWEISREEKRKLETAAMMELSRVLPNGKYWLEVWRAYDSGETQTSHIVNQLDKMCPIVQAVVYRRKYPSITSLNEFYDNSRHKVTNKDLGDIIDIIHKGKHPVDSDIYQTYFELLRRARN